jgi:hypothetical protein
MDPSSRKEEAWLRRRCESPEASRRERGRRKTAYNQTPQGTKYEEILIYNLLYCRYHPFALVARQRRRPRLRSGPEMQRGRPETGSFERDQENERKRILRFITSNNLSQPLIRAADRVNHYSASGRRASSVASDIDCCLAVWFTWIVEFGMHAYIW